MLVDIPRAAELTAHLVVAIMLCRRTRPGTTLFAPTLRPLFWFLSATLVSDVVRMALKYFILRDAPRPFEGMTRVVFHLDELGVVGWNACLVMVAALAFSDRQQDKPRIVVPIVMAACAAWGQLVGGYPVIRGEKLEQAYFALELVTVAACFGLALLAWSRDRWFGLAARATTILIAAEGATLLGPYLGDLFKYWATANVISACAYVVMAWELRRAKSVAA